MKCVYLLSFCWLPFPTLSGLCCPRWLWPRCRLCWRWRSTWSPSARRSSSRGTRGRSSGSNLRIGEEETKTSGSLGGHLPTTQCPIRQPKVEAKAKRKKIIKMLNLIWRKQTIKSKISCNNSLRKENKF